MSIFSRFFKKEKKEIELPLLDASIFEVDMHGHFLDGIDDGSSSIEMSLEMVKGLRERGYSKIVCTPHVMHDFYKNSTDVILRKTESLQNYLIANNVEIPLVPSAEYYFDEELTKRLKSNDLLSFGKENYLLFEFSYFNEHSGVNGVLSDMFAAGYSPVLAHPERYPYYGSNPERYHQLKEMGVKFQLNMMSFAGRYGEGAKQTANWLIDNNMVDFVGTDIHRNDHLPIIDIALKTESLHRLAENYPLLNKTLK